MATAPVKSQPLHNFCLPHLKWGNRSQNNANHRLRRLSEPDNNSLSNRNRSSPSETDSDAEKQSKLLAGSRTALNHFSFSLCSMQRQQNDIALEREANTAEDVEVKPWNLRPRKAAVATKVSVDIGAASFRNNGEAFHENETFPKSTRFERKEKRKLWISLSREEIEEDVYALTGSRPARRPKKRPKALQKQLDSVFPGLYLVGLSVDSYRVHDALV